ncbi:hypothetical protein D0T53_05455 [Dysgonomonas sp. 216]|uniref:hypothetical protein n=1 Tax=Dysgonomonas sp. 216 TaxID=2302934 RepID=UPI0013D3AFBC|nr:hypothetical protein [Dysgonomonas sp. 216]NDW18363.1 hypothetical protein [Dysgonomonas sp. 216]
MGVIDKLFNLFLNKEYSIKSKILWGVLLIILIIGINDFVGFTFYYSASKEIELISQIETTKQTTNNKELLSYLDSKEKEILNRKYLYEKFLDLFKQTELVNDSKNEVNSSSSNNTSFISEIFPEMPYRSQLWHTITSSFVQILALIILLILCIIAPFRTDIKDKQSVGIYIIIFILSSALGAGLIWLTQFLFGLIPVILDRAYINYGIQILFQILLIYISIKTSKNRAE